MRIMYSALKEYIGTKKILILGFGREGKASVEFLSSLLPIQQLAVSDQSKETLKNLSKEIKQFHGDSYLSCTADFDLIVKTPGIPSKELLQFVSKDKISSQTDLFLRLFSKQIIGISGTKGKSTTSSLIHHLLRTNAFDSILVGNIGVPPFSLIDQITSQTKIVFELSSHQLEFVNFSPHISVLLNLFQEHLDHYPDFNAYQDAKWNITKFQKKDDYFYFHGKDELLLEKLKSKGTNASLTDFSFKDDNDRDGFRESFGLTSRVNLSGNHNLLNIRVAALIAMSMGLSQEQISKSINSYKGLQHRLENVGEYGGVRFYNDSISTIPESTIEAIKSLKEVDTLILGGKDRGVDYSKLISYLINYPIEKLIFMGEAGHRILDGLKAGMVRSQLFEVENFDDIGNIIKLHSTKGKICLLSPAASSYDWFKNYADRGNRFCEIVKSLF